MREHKATSSGLGHGSSPRLQRAPPLSSPSPPLLSFPFSLLLSSAHLTSPLPLLSSLLFFSPPLSSPLHLILSSALFSSPLLSSLLLSYAPLFSLSPSFSLPWD